MIIDRDNYIIRMASSNTIVISFSIAILLLLTLLLLVSYNSKCKMDNIERFYTEEPPTQQNVYNNVGGGSAQAPSVAENANKVADTNKPGEGIGSYDASDPLGNEVYNEVVTDGVGPNAYDNIPQNQACFPRDRLTADDLLPKDANSKWAQLNPSGAGNVQDQNYLTAGYHIGINTVGQSLRNANLQLRSEPPNPTVPVGPWSISTIEYDNNRRPLEIGSGANY